jgi:hypothetical protein
MAQRQPPGLLFAVERRLTAGPLVEANIEDLTPSLAYGDPFAKTARRASNVLAARDHDFDGSL